ncbi:MAG: serine acetyltransferase [Marinagarivorans sp.]|nr:serine acetyltransferase [Marinagarivorans sp.]
MNPISATEPDWTREECTAFWQPSKQMLKSLRRYQALDKENSLIDKVASKWWTLSHRFWSVVCGCDIPLNCQIGGGLVLLHPNGVVIHPDAVIGPNCFILQQVTIVSSVEIGGHVDIGAGAKIIRPIKIGDRARIGANAVVTKSIAAGATAAGIPAKIIKVTSLPQT